MKPLDFTEIQALPKWEPQHPLYVLLDGIHIPENMATIARVCEAFAVREIWTIHMDMHKVDKIQKKSRNTFNQLQWYSFEQISEIKQATESIPLIGLEWTTESTTIYSTTFPNGACLVVGSERYGISKSLLDILDSTIHIPMLGINSSMNVAQALSIGIYEFRRQEKAKI